MNISILTLFPELYTPFFSTSLVGRAQEAGKLSPHICNLFDFCAPKQRIDSPSFGPGSGMLIRPDVIERAVVQQEERHGKAYKIFFSPQGKKLDQSVLKQLYSQASEQGHMLLVASRYEGVDARVEEAYADLTLSIGDYVLMGGDLPAMVLLEGLLRFMPGVVGKTASVEADSFSGPFVDYPEYTQPVEWNGRVVPEVVRSGNHAAIAQWREEQAAQKTVKQHFSWLRSRRLSKENIALARRFIPSHYAVLMHGDVLLKDQQDPTKTKVGTTSVTSFDLHDIARSAKTYGLENYFIVTPLHDQQRIIQSLLDFWCTPGGIKFNPHRFEALKHVHICNTLDEVIAFIEKKEGKKPLLLATSARRVAHQDQLTYFDQDKVWKHDRPVLFVFGTGKGLAEHVVERCDYLLAPLEGFSDFNHLSVRSAAGIVFDRWLGITSKE